MHCNVGLMFLFCANRASALKDVEVMFLETFLLILGTFVTLSAIVTSLCPLR